MSAADTNLKKTALYELHRGLAAKMVPFAGYEMPVQYPMGVLKEHLHTREKAGLFDVSHMGQAVLKLPESEMGKPGAHEKIAAAIEQLVPGDIKALKPGRMRLSVLLSEDGGILDDLMITRPAEDEMQGALYLVVNAARKDHDYALLSKKLAGLATLDIQEQRALIALQGPKAATVADSLLPGAAEQKFMSMQRVNWRAAEGDVELLLSRCGYTGEDGFEISVPNSHAVGFAEALLADADVEPIGLGARDSLRLEAGLCLYGHDLDETTSPVEAGLSFVIGKRRREEGGFPGAARILRELKEGPKRLRVGLKPQGRAPAREGAEIQSTDGAVIGAVTSGGFGPTMGAPVAMGYVDAAFAKTGTAVNLIVRGRALSAIVADMPIVPQN